MVLRRIAYVSRVSGGDYGALERIGETSRANNARHGLTGVLGCDGAYFGQVIEGNADAVDAAFARIRDDPRHTDVCVLGVDPVRRRRFEAWSMATVRARTLRLARFHRRQDISDADDLLEALADAALADAAAGGELAV